MESRCAATSIRLTASDASVSTTPPCFPACTPWESGNRGPPISLPKENVTQVDLFDARRSSSVRQPASRTQLPKHSDSLGSL